MAEAAGPALSCLDTATTGDSERGKEFWMVAHLHDAAQRET
ncbi:hypothetical protein [Streptomyces sp. NPDC059063]